MKGLADSIEVKPELVRVWALLEHIKTKYPDTTVVFVTAVHDISVALAAIRNGAYDYLLVPCERDQLLAVVRRSWRTGG